MTALEMEMKVLYENLRQYNLSLTMTVYELKVTQPGGYHITYYINNEPDAILLRRLNDRIIHELGGRR